MSAEIASFILEHLPVAEVSETPGVRLHLAGTHSRLWKLAERYPDMGSPYWAHPWGGGLALARYLQAHPEVVVGRRVLDLGAGSGLVGIVAALAGARSVAAVDVDPIAVAAIPMNAALNGVTVQARGRDLLGGAAPDVDIVLVGDLFYEAELADRVTAFLDRCLAAGLEVLVGDPWRAFLPQERLVMLSQYDVPDFGSRAAGPAAAFRFVAPR